MGCFSAVITPLAKFKRRAWQSKWLYAVSRMAVRPYGSANELFVARVLQSQPSLIIQLRCVVTCHSFDFPNSSLETFFTVK